MDSELLKKFRDEFSSQHIDPPSPHFANFDRRDVARLLENDRYASSFLSWRKRDVGESVKLVVTAFEWRKKININDLSMRDIGDEFYARKGFFVRGRCKNGNRVVYFIAKLYVKEDEAKMKKMFVYLLEKMRRDDPGSKVTLILNAGGCGMANVNLSVIRMIVDCFMSYFPDMLGRTFIVDLPLILIAVWNVVRLWFDEELRNRTRRCARKDLEKHIDPEQTMAIVGGKDTWNPGKCDADLAAEFSNDDDDDDDFADAVENLQISGE